MLNPGELATARYVAATSVACERVRGGPPSGVRRGALTLASGWVESAVTDLAGQETWWSAVERAVDAEIFARPRSTTNDPAGVPTEQERVLLLVAVVVALGRLSGRPETTIRREALSTAAVVALSDRPSREATLCKAAAIVDQALATTR